MELQSSLSEAKEEAVRLKEATNQQLEEADAQWAEDRRKMSDKADQAIKVSVASHIYQTVRGDYGQSTSRFLSHSAALVFGDTLGVLQNCVTFQINPTFNHRS